MNEMYGEIKMAIKFISDLHFCHKNILKFNKSGNDEWRINGFRINDPTENFTDIKQYNEFLVEQWNLHTKDTDIVYILGDVGLGNPNEVLSYLNQLHGFKYLVKGNHDYKLLNLIKEGMFSNKISYLADSIIKLDIENKTFILSHYPIMDFEGENRGYIHLYGHIHNMYALNRQMEDQKIFNESFYEKAVYTYNVGCMLPWMNYYPKTFNEIQKGEFLFYNNKGEKTL